MAVCRVVLVFPAGPYLRHDRGTDTLPVVTTVAGLINLCAKANTVLDETAIILRQVLFCSNFK